jgi:hypothetical protein
MKCGAVLDCARKNSCYDTTCYCGDAPFCSPPNGKCLTEIEMAAGSTDLSAINDAKGNRMNPLGKAYTADTCRVQQCASQCR